MTSRRPSTYAETPVDKPGPHARAKPAASPCGGGTPKPGNHHTAAGGARFKVGSTHFESAASVRITAFLCESLLLAQKNGDTQKRTSGIMAKKMGWLVAFLPLGLFAESSNHFYANTINCVKVTLTTFSLKIWCS